MSRISIAAVLTTLLPACGTVVPQLLGPPPGRHQVPPRIQALCSPMFRDTDVETIIVSISAAKDDGATKSTALSNANTACADTASALLAIGQDENADFEFDAVDAAAFQDDCFNCYVAIIDAIYSR